MSRRKGRAEVDAAITALRQFEGHSVFEKVEELFLARIEVHRDQLEACPIEEHHRIMGRIEECRELLKILKQ